MVVLATLGTRAVEHRTIGKDDSRHRSALPEASLKPMPAR
jgi:hypothetical protein